jgi:phosphoglucomutase
MLSYAVRYFKAAGGVMITASHNPAKYNGYKAYGEDGGQLPPEAAQAAHDSMTSIRDIRSIHWISKEEAAAKGLLTYFGEELDNAYDAMLKKLSINPDAVKKNKDMKIVFTPLHGTGNKPVRRILKEIGFDNVIVVPEQELPDPDFSTVKSPNPEDLSALKLAIGLAEKEKAEIIVATDPDADRTALVVRDHDGRYLPLSGNQIGILLLDYVLNAKEKSGLLPPDSFAVTTIVSTRISRFIAEYYRIKLFEVYTGFKFIAEVIKDKDEFGTMHFQFGFEESFGYLAGTDVRDKDAVVTVMLISEMAAVARSESKTLVDKLQELYNKYAYAAEKSFSIMSEGKEGLEKITRAMYEMRKNKASVINGVAIDSISDYLNAEKTDFKNGVTTPIDMETSDVLLYELGGQDWFCFRPSGTEPKIKIYFGIYGKEEQHCNEKLQDLSIRIEQYIRSFI